MNFRLEFFKAPYNAQSFKDQYRELCKKHHPDKGGNTETFQRLQKEYDFVQTLGKIKRKAKRNVAPNFQRRVKIVYDNLSEKDRERLKDIGIDFLQRAADAILRKI